MIFAIVEYRSLSSGEFGIVSNNEKWYEGFPSIEFITKEKFICIFRRSVGAIGGNHHLLITFSNDGINWSTPKVFALPLDEEEGELWNSPFVQKYPDNHIEVICDIHDMYKPQDAPGIYLWESLDLGKTWKGPKMLPIMGVNPTHVIINPKNNSERLLPVHYRNPITHRLVPIIYKTIDNGKNWWANEILKPNTNYEISETSVVMSNNLGLKEPVLLAFIRNIGKKTSNITQLTPIQVSISFDFGKTWSFLINSSLIGHRANAKMLNDGRLMISLGMYDEEREIGCTAAWIAEINDEIFLPKNRNKFKMVNEKKKQKNQKKKSEKRKEKYYDKKEQSEKIKDLMIENKNNNKKDIMIENKTITWNDLFLNQILICIEKEEKGTRLYDFGHSDWIQDKETGDVIIVYQTRKKSSDCYIKSIRFNPNDL